jgi:PST family polysaccharide transporter
LKTKNGQTSSQAIRWMAWSGAGRILNMFVSIASVAVLARLLTQEDYGVFAAAMIFIGIVKSGLVQGGFPTAVIQRQDLTTLHIRNAFTGILLIHLVAAVLIWVGSGSIAEFFDMPQLAMILKVMCLIVLVNPVLSISLALLRRRKRFRLLAITDLLSSVFANTAVAIGLAWAGYGVWALVISTITWTVAQTVIAFAVARFNLIPVITSHMRDLLHISMGFTVGGALAVVTDHAAKFVTGRILGADALGVFGRANRILDFPMTLLSSTHVLFPVMADVNDDRLRMGRGYLRAIALCSLVAIPLTVLVWHASEGLILLLLGERWTDAVEPTAILSLTLVFGLGFKVATVVFMALGKVKAIVVRQGLFALLITAGSVIGSRWGIEGVCVAVLLTYAACYVLGVQMSNTLLAVTWRAFAKANLPAVLLALPVLGFLVAGETFVWGDVQKNLQFPIEAIVTGITVYAVCLAKPAWFLGPDGTWLLLEIRQYVPARLRILIPGGGVPQSND